jgi:transcriptional regulator with XRE-family HTH domain
MTNISYSRNRGGGEQMENRFKELRISAGISLPEAATALNTTTRSVLRWEKGDYEPSAGILKEMSFLYKTTLDDLLANPIPPSIKHIANSDKRERSGSR